MSHSSPEVIQAANETMVAVETVLARDGIEFGECTKVRLRHEFFKMLRDPSSRFNILTSRMKRHTKSAEFK